MRASTTAAPRRVLLASGATLAGLLALASLAPARVGGAATARATLEVVRPVRLAPQSTLAFGRAVGPQGGTITVAPVVPVLRSATGATLLPGDVASPFVATVSGEPGRAYRISLPSRVAAAPGGFTVSGFTVASRTAGAVTASRQAQLDADGTDTLMIGATLTLPKGAKPQSYTAQVPVAISYE